MDRDSFVFYKSFYTAPSKLPPEERLGLYEAIIEFGLYGTEPQKLNITQEMAFELIRPQLEANNKRFVNGSKGGRPKKEENQRLEKNKPMVNENNNHRFNEEKPEVIVIDNHKLNDNKPMVSDRFLNEKPNVNDNVNVNVNVNDNVNVNKNQNDKEKINKKEDEFSKAKELAKKYAHFGGN